MAHFAELDESQTVIAVIVVNNDVLMGEDGRENEQRGIDYLNARVKQSNWVQTSYNGTSRRRFAGIGYTYSVEHDVFLMPQPFPSWSLDLTCDHDWRAPIPKPDDETQYWTWNEESQQWEGIDKPMKPPIETLGE